MAKTTPGVIALVLMFLGRLGKRLLHYAGISAWRHRTLPFGVVLRHDLARLFGPEPPAMILDVGGHVGRVSLLLHRKYPSSRIHVFEPVQESYNRLLTATRHTENIQAHNVALGSAPGDAPIYVGSPRSHASMVASEELLSTRREVRVDVDTVDAFCERTRIERVDLLKIDTEGYELEVLKGASRMLQEDRVRFIYAECEFVRVTTEPHGNFFALYEFLEPMRFRFVTLYTDAADARGFHWGNALFAHQEAPESDP